MSRKIAREIGIQMLFQYNFQKENTNELVDVFLKNIQQEKLHNDKPLKSLNESDIGYIKDIVNGTIQNLQEIDNKIDSLAKDWTIDRLSKVDLSILRLAIYEILFRDDVPNEVAINEAVELAKKYGTDDSKSFINGILGKVVD